MFNAAGSLDRGVGALGGIAFLSSEPGEGKGEILRGFREQQGDFVGGGVGCEFHDLQFADEVLGGVENLVEIG